jgi:hypothetical protein
MKGIEEEINERSIVKEGQGRKGRKVDGEEGEAEAGSPC